jgi:hypothetical protein
LGRNQYVELEIKKPKANGASTKLSACQKPCEKIAEAIVMDGGKSGQIGLHSNTSASLTAFFRSCSDPKYRSVVRIDSCPSRN